MANETAVLEVSNAGASGRKPTGKVALVYADGSDVVLGGSNYSGEGSYQQIWGDLTVADDAGSDDGTDTAFVAPIMGNVLGDAVAGEGNYLAGVIGAMSVAAPESEYPVAAVLGIVMDGSDGAHSAVHAHIDGSDPSAKTHVNAMFGVSIANNHADSGATYGLSLKGDANDNYSGTGIAFVPDTADIQLSNGAVVAVGSASTRDAVRSQVGTGCAIGSLYLSSAGKAYLKVAAGDATTDWQKVTTSAAD